MAREISDDRDCTGGLRTSDKGRGQDPVSVCAGHHPNCGPHGIRDWRLKCNTQGALAEYVCSMLGQWSWSFTISQCIGKNTKNHHVAVAQQKGCLFIVLRKPDLSLGWKGSGKRDGRILIHGSFLERSTNKALPRHHGLSISFPKLTLKINFTH